VTAPRCTTSDAFSSDVGVQPAPTAVAGAVLLSLEPTAFTRFSRMRSLTREMTIDQASLFSSHRFGSLSAPLIVPIGSVIKQVDGFGTCSANGCWHWFLREYDLSAGTCVLVSAATSPTGPGVLQTTLNPDFTVAAGHIYELATYPTTAPASKISACVQYVPPAPR